MKFPAIATFFLSSFFYLLFSVALAPSAFAQTQSLPQNSFAAPNNNPDVPKNLHTFSQNVLIEVIAAVDCQLTGIDPLSPNQKCLGLDQKTGQIGFVEGGSGAIGLMGKMITVLYTPPIHTNEYVRYLTQNFGIAKTAYADQGDRGLGFAGLSPLIKLWSVFRNVVYLIIVLIFIIVGLTIMLRIKIDARTVMSIENQLPKVIISLLLVTFSFAIAALLIDVMYVAIFLVFNLFNNPDVMCPNQQRDCKPRINIIDVQQNFNGQNALGFFNNLNDFSKTVTYSAGGVKDVVRDLFSTKSYKSRDWELSWESIVGKIGEAVNFANNGFAFLFGGIAGVLALLIFSIALLWALFRLWFELIKAYIFFLIDVVFAPFFIITGVFPGGLGFGGWLRDVLSNLSPFPVTITMFLLGNAFMSQFDQQGADRFTLNPTNPHPLFVPPLIGNPNDSQAIMSLIGFGIILITPQVVIMMKDVLKAPQFKYVAAIGQAMGVGGSVTSGTGKEMLGTALSYLRGNPLEGPRLGKAGEGITSVFKRFQMKI